MPPQLWVAYGSVCTVALLVMLVGLVGLAWQMGNAKADSNEGVRDQSRGRYLTVGDVQVRAGAGE